MSYTALYRKWRPLSFEEMVGQETIVKTLLNQIASGRIAHAYLFTGTRGTGKTTAAKIFSRAVNCTSKEQIPCNQCSNCMSILDESNMDVIEIDAASNNGVDDIRELRENVKYPPSNGQYKVFIIDEVHMLSKGAFNALLKTLEEPPTHVIFILATTEPHKIPATIHSRCQRFDFKRISYPLVEKLLLEICEKEGRQCDDEALKLIVQCSDGALRDALSILDRCLSFEEGQLTHERALQILGYSGEQFIAQVIKAMTEHDIETVLRILNSAVDEGKDLHQFTRELVEFNRRMLLVLVSQNSNAIIDVSKEMQSILMEMAQKIGIQTLMDWLNQCSKLEAEAKWSQHPRALIELTLIKLMQPSEKNLLTSLQDRVLNIENAIKNAQKMPYKQGGVLHEERPRTVNNPFDKRQENRESPERVNGSEQQLKEDTPETKIDYTLEGFRDKWNIVLAALKKSRVSTYALLMEGQLMSLDGNVLKIGFEEKFEFHRMALEKEDNRVLVEKIIEQETGQSVRLNCTLKEDHVVGEKSATKSEWVEGIVDFFKDYEDKLMIDPPEEEA